MTIEKERISGIPNGFNSCISEFDVTVIPTPARTFVVVHDFEGSLGPSITNCAEYACPHIAQMLGLSWAACTFIESYPPLRKIREFDPSFDLINFKGPVEQRSVYGFRHGVLFAPLAQPGWVEVPSDHVAALTNAGYMLSAVLGRKAVFSKDDAAVEALIVSYNGRFYDTDKGRFSYAALRRVGGVASISEKMGSATMVTKNR